MGQDPLAPDDGSTIADRWREAERLRQRAIVERSGARVENLAAELRSAVRALHDARRQLAALDDPSAATDPILDLPIATLHDVASVAEVDDRLIVVTRPLVLSHAGEDHDIGAFEIELSHDRGARIRSASSPDGRRGAWIHPHVQGDLPCLGNARVGVEKLLGLGEVAAAVDVLIGFLRTYDAETAYCSIGNWPVIPGRAESGT